MAILDAFTWSHRFDSLALNQYGLLAIELPGRGQSSDSSGSFLDDYNPIVTGKIIADALKPIVHHYPFILVGF